MKFKRDIIAIVLIIGILFMISAVSAADSTQEAVSAANASDEVTGISLDSAKNLATENDGEILGDGETDDGSFAALNTKITTADADSTVYLKNDYFYSSTDDLDDGVYITQNLIIDGEGHTIDANGKINIFNIYGDNVQATIKNIVFKNGKSDYGGAIYWSSQKQCNIINCTFINNTDTSFYGGAICIYQGIASIQKSTFINNTAYGSNGGAISIRNGPMGINYCTFINNRASGNGGAIYSSTSNNVNIRNSIFIDNQGNKVIYSPKANTQVYNNWFGNTIENYDETPDVSSELTLDNWFVLDLDLDHDNHVATVSLNNLYENDVLTKNYDEYALPSINIKLKGFNIEVPNNINLSEKGNATIEHDASDAYSLTVSYNSVQLKKEIKPTFILLNSTIKNTESNIIDLTQDYEFDLTKDADLSNGIEIKRSITIDGHGYVIDAKGLKNIFYFNDVDNDKTLILKNIIFRNAIATNGAAIYFKGKNIEIINCTFINNTASADGDALYIISSEQSNIKESTFVNNTGSASVAYLSSDSTIEVSNSIFINNTGKNIVKCSGTVVADYNWWGNNATNYNDNMANVGDGITISKWLLLNIAFDETNALVKVSLNNLNDGTIYNNYALPDINLNIHGSNIVADEIITVKKPGESYLKYSMIDNTGIVTASYADTSFAKEIRFIDVGDFNSLNTLIYLASSSVPLTLNHDYVYSENDTITKGIPITKALTIDGAGYTIDAKSKSRIFLISADNCVFKNITFANGKSDKGGAIYSSAESMDVDNCTFINNSASMSGGAIYSNSNSDMGTITNSLFINNSAPTAGVIYDYAWSFDSSMNIIDKCIFINNTASNYLVFIYGSGSIENSILLNNNAPYNLYTYYGGTLTLYKNWFGNTINDNQNKIRYVYSEAWTSPTYYWLCLNIKFYETYAIVSLNNLASIYGTSSTVSSNDLPNITLNINSTTLNLETDKITLDNLGKCIVPYTMSGETGSLTVSYNGISLTKERKLGEFDSLQSLIDSHEPNSLIELNRNYTFIEGLDELTEGILIDKNLTIDGKGHTIDANNMARIFNVQATGVTFRNINFVNGNSEYGSAINLDMDNDEAIDFNVENCTFINNTATESSKNATAAIKIQAKNGTYNIKDSVFVNNTASRSNYGPAIYVTAENAKFSLNNCTFMNNGAYVGAIGFETKNVTSSINYTTFINNKGSYYGSAINFNETGDGDLLVNNSIFLNNVGSYIIYNVSGNLVADNNWWGNIASERSNYYKNNLYSVYNGKPNNWVFINSTIQSSIHVGETTNAHLYFQLYNTATGEVTSFDNNRLPKVNFTLTSDLGQINKNNVFINEEFDYAAIEAGFSTITADCCGFEYPIDVVNKQTSEITLLNDTIILYYGDEPVLSNFATLNHEGKLKFESLNPDAVAITTGSNPKFVQKYAEGEAIIVVSYDGYNYYDAAETKYFTVKVVKAPVIINVTNLECNNLTLNVSDTFNLTVELVVDLQGQTYHTGYQTAGWNSLGTHYPNNSNIYDSAHIIDVNKKQIDSKKGNVTIKAVTGGNITLTLALDNDAQANSFNAEDVTINIKVNRIPTEITADDISPIKVDDESSVNANFFINGTQANKNLLVYESGDEDIIKFINDNEFKAVGSGTVVLTVRYAGNSTHENTSKTITVTVNRYDVNINSNYDSMELNVSETFKIIGTLDNSEVTGVLNYTSSNSSVVTVDNETGDIVAVGNGTAIITIYYPGDRKYENTTKAVTIKVNKIKTDLTLTSSDLTPKYGEAIELTPTVKAIGEEITGVTVTYFIGDTEITSPFTVDRVGEFNITAKYAGNYMYLPSERNITITSSKADNNIEVSVSKDKAYPDEVTITVSSLVPGEYTIDINGSEVTVTIPDGETQASTNYLFGAGSYYANISAVPQSQYYNQLTNNDTFSVAKGNNKVTITVEDTYLPGIVTVKVEANAPGIYVVTFNDSEKTSLTFKVETENGDAINITTLLAGSYDANLTGADYDNYTVEAENDTFEVKRSDIDLEIFVDEIVYGKNVTGYIIANVTGTYTVTISDADEFTVDAVAGEKANFTKAIKLDAAQDYNAVASIDEQPDYNAKSAQSKFNVVQAESGFDVEYNETYTYANDIIVKINLPQDATGKVTFKYADGDKIGEVNISETREFKLPVLDVGSYNITANYTGDNNYKGLNQSIVFEVTKADNYIVVSVIASDYLSNVTVLVTSDVEGTYTVDINGTEYDVAANGGGRSIKLAAGSYYANITGYVSSNYNGITYNTTFTVRKAINVIVVNVEDKTLPGNVTIRVNSNIPDTYTIKINETYSVDVVVDETGDGIASIYIPAGNGYQTAVEIKDTQNYTLKITEATFNVEKAINNILVEASNATYPQEVTINVTADVDGEYIVKINDTTVIVNVVNGFGSNRTSLNLGSYATLTEFASDDYDANITEAEFSVLPKFKGNLTIGDADYPENDTIGLVGEGNVYIRLKYYLAKPDAEISVESLRFNVSGKIIPIQTIVYEEYVEISFDFNETSEIIVSAEYIAMDYDDNTYELTSNSLTYDMIIKNSTVLMEVGQTVYQDNATVTISAANDGLYNVTVEGKTYEANVTDGVATVVLDVLPVGKYNITIVSQADESIKNVTSFEVSKASDIQLDIDVKDGVITIDNSFNATGNLTIKIGNDTYPVNMSNGGGIAAIDLYPGEYNATLIYSGDDNYAEITKNVTVTVPKVGVLEDDLLIAVTLNDNPYSDVSINLPQDATGNLTVNVSGEIYTSELVNGSATVKIDNLEAGDYNATITYSGDGKYAFVAKNTTLTIPKAEILENDTSVDISIANGTTSSQFTVELPEDATGNVTVTVNGQNYTAEVINGTATVDVPEMAVGDYNVTVTYSGDRKYSSFAKRDLLSVPKADIQDTSVEVNVTEGSQTPEVDIALPKDINGFVVVTVDGVDLYVPVENGTANITLPELSFGDHTVTVSYLGNDKYNSFSKNTTVSIGKPELSANDLAIRYTNQYNYKVLVTYAGKAVSNVYVTFTLDGNTYKRLTDSNGYAILKLPKVKPGKYNITATCKGVSITKTVKVNHIIYIKNTKVKKSAKVSKINVKLLTVNGKYLAGKKVTLKVLGKTFKAKTNKKGVAVFKIKGSLFKKVKVGSICKYKVTCGYDVAYKNIVVKR